METTITSGQLAATLRLLEDKRVTPERYSQILSSGVLADMLDANAKLDNREAVRAALGFEVKEGAKPLLVQRGIISVGPLTERFDPAAFYKTCTDLSVWPEFANRILSAATVVEHAPATTLAVFDLARLAYDREICANLSITNFFEAQEACWIIAELIQRQSNGERGDLLTNRDVNIVYVRGIQGEGFAVLVDWDPGYCVWRVRTWQLGHARTTGRILSRN